MIHTVEQGEHLASIAKKYGFADFGTLWVHPNNAHLKDLRQNPNLLFPGDKVFVPEKTEKFELGDTAKVNLFQLKRQKVLLKVVVQDVDGNPAKDTFYFLRVHEDVLAHNTDGKGMTNDEIQAEDRDGNLLLKDKRLEFRLKIGALNPLIEKPQEEADPKLRNEAIAAWQERLNNLGYFAGFAAKDENQLRWAIEEFQCEHGWTPKEKKKKPNGKTDKETRDKLEEVYGC